MGLPITGWFEGPTLIGANSGAGIVQLATGEILVCGGYTTNGDKTSQAFLIAGDGRSIVGLINPMTVARAFHQIIEVYPYVFVIGGDDTESAEVYNQTTHTWAAAAAIGYGGTSLLDAMLVAPGGGHIRVMGGIDFNGTNNCYDHVRDYDPSSNTWTTIASLPAPRAGGGAFFDSGGYTVIGGGYATGGAGYNDALIYNGVGWSNMGAFSDGVAKAFPLNAPFPFGDGRFLLAGGIPSTVPPQVPCKSAFVYTPGVGGGTWARIGDMIDPRFSSIGGSMVTSRCLAVLSDGHMIAFSNASRWHSGSELPYTRCEILDPMALTWSALPETRFPVDEVVALATSNNDVIVIGGDYAGGLFYPSSRIQTSDATFAPPAPGSPPIITSISPSPGTDLAPQQALAFNAISPAGRALTAVVILMNYPNTGAYEVVHDGTNFAADYTGTRSPITNGFAFTGVVRKGGWPSPPNIIPIVVDSSGLENA